MAKILLIEPDMKMTGRRFDPLGLCCISAYMKRAGHETRIFQHTEESLSHIESLFDRFDPDVVGFSCLDVNFNEGRKIARALRKKKQIATFFGGEHATAHPEIVEDPAIDYAVIGEGEKTFEEMVERLLTGRKDMEGIKGCSFFNGQETVVNERRERIDDLDSLPFPDRDVIKNYRYIFPGLASLAVPPQKQKIACATMSRGCLFNCTFCTTPFVWMRKFYTRSPQNMADELEELASEGYNLIYFQDETFTTRPKVILELCKTIVERDIKISWTCLTRLSTLNDELLKWMRRAGCFYMAVGVEAASDETLSKIDKKLSTSQVREKVKMVHSHDISICGLMMIGYPWETEEQILSYSKYINSLALDSVRIRFLTPFKGTRLHKEITEQGLLLSENPYSENTERPTIKMESMTPGRLIELRNLIQKRYYLRPAYIFRALMRTLRHPSYLVGYITSFMFFRKVQKRDRRLLTTWDDITKANQDPSF